MKLLTWLYVSGCVHAAGANEVSGFVVEKSVSTDVGGLSCRREEIVKT